MRNILTIRNALAIAVAAAVVLALEFGFQWFNLVTHEGVAYRVTSAIAVGVAMMVLYAKTDRG